MYSLVPQIIIFGSLLWASRKDAEKGAVKDYVFLAGLLPSLAATFYLEGLSALLPLLSSMGVLFFLGLLLQNIDLENAEGTAFGGADIWVLVLSAASFYKIPSLQVASLVLVPYMAYMYLAWKITGERQNPAIPGLTLGYLATWIYFLLFFF